MEFNIKRDVFLAGIQKTLGIVEKKTTMPILSNLLLMSGQNRVTIVATDREMGIVADYEAEVISEGKITLSARKLHEMVREIQGDKIHIIKKENDVVVLTCNKATYRIPGIPADDYPMVVNEEIPFYPVKGGALKELIRKTGFAMSTDEMRKTLCGVLMEMEEIGETFWLRMVATDGHRLSMMKVETSGKIYMGMEKNVIIPRKGVMEIRRLVEDEAGDVMFGVRQGMCIIKTDHTMLKVSLIDGDYPDYRRVIPADKGFVVDVDKNKFLHAIRRMGVISSERYNGVIMTLYEDKMILNSNNPDVGEADDEIDVLYAGEKRSVGYNITYLSDAVDVIDEDMVAFEVGEGMKPGIVRAVGNDNYFCIVMPLKL
jgi:DNA polymerase-3 subunit beta